MDLPRLLPARAHGAPLALPDLVDRAAAGWWALPPRVRLVVGAVVVVAVLAVAGRGATTSPWGPPRPVWVLAGDVPAGAPVTAADLRRTSWPADLVPDDAVAGADADAVVGDGSRLRTAGVAGSVLTTRALAPGTAGLLDRDGTVAVSVPVDGLPGLQVGDVVDVVATASDGAGRRVTSGARVAAADGAWLWLAVAAPDADAVAAAGADGRLAVTVRPP